MIQSYWSLQPGNDKWTWFDAKLTPTGTDQALTARKAWKKHLEKNRIPAPESYYVSPLMRCLQTARLTFEGIGVAGTKPFKPVIKEVLDAHLISFYSFHIDFTLGRIRIYLLTYWIEYKRNTRNAYM